MGQMGIKFHEYVTKISRSALELSERIRYKIEMTNVHFYVESEILNSILFKLLTGIIRLSTKQKNKNKNSTNLHPGKISRETYLESL